MIVCEGESVRAHDTCLHVCARVALGEVVLSGVANELRVHTARSVVLWLSLVNSYSRSNTLCP